MSSPGRDLRASRADAEDGAQARTTIANRARTADHLASPRRVDARRAEYIARRNELITPRLISSARRAHASRAAGRRHAALSQSSSVVSPPNSRPPSCGASSRPRPRTVRPMPRSCSACASRSRWATRSCAPGSRMTAPRASRPSAQLRQNLLQRYQAYARRGERHQHRSRAACAVRSRTRRSRCARCRTASVSARRRWRTESDSLQRELDRERSDGRVAADVLAQRENKQITQQREELTRLQHERKKTARVRAEAENARINRHRGSGAPPQRSRSAGHAAAAAGRGSAGPRRADRGRADAGAQRQAGAAR